MSSLVEVVSAHDGKLNKLTDDLILLKERQEKTDEQIRATDEKLGILIRLMDEWVRRNPPGGGDQ